MTVFRIEVVEQTVSDRVEVLKCSTVSHASQYSDYNWALTRLGVCGDADLRQITLDTCLFTIGCCAPATTPQPQTKYTANFTSCKYHDPRLEET